VNKEMGYVKCEFIPAKKDYERVPVMIQSAYREFFAFIMPMKKSPNESSPEPLVVK